MSIFQGPIVVLESCEIFDDTVRDRRQSPVPQGLYSRGQSKSTNWLSGQELNVSMRFFQI